MAPESIRCSAGEETGEGAGQRPTYPEERV